MLVCCLLAMYMLALLAATKVACSCAACWPYPAMSCQIVNVRGSVESRLERIRAREMSATLLALAGAWAQRTLALCMLCLLRQRHDFVFILTSTLCPRVGRRVRNRAGAGGRVGDEVPGSGCA